VSAIEPVKEARTFSHFFDMWRQEHADADCKRCRDMVMASGSGLTRTQLKNASSSSTGSGGVGERRESQGDDTRKEIEECCKKTRRPRWVSGRREDGQRLEVNSSCGALRGA